VTLSDTAPVLRVLIDDYLKRSAINITPDHEADHLAMGMSFQQVSHPKAFAFEIGQVGRTCVK
jgi:LysR family hca operon transcriptional activator